MIQCCGQTRTSKFCPDCGKVVKPTLANLSAYLDTQAAKHIQRSQTWAKKENRAKQVKRIEQEANTLLAWSKLVAPAPVKAPAS